MKKIGHETRCFSFGGSTVQGIQVLDKTIFAYSDPRKGIEESIDYITVSNFYDLVKHVFSFDLIRRRARWNLGSLKRREKKRKSKLKQQMREKREKNRKKALHFTQPANLFEMTQQPKTTTKTIIRKKTN